MKTNLIEKMTVELEKINNENSRKRSAWGRGIAVYTAEIMETVKESIEYSGKEPENYSELKSMMLNGASDWSAYSWGGCSLIYDTDIAKTLCSPSELKKTDGGNRRPNSREEWLDVQARALAQAAKRIYQAWKAATACRTDVEK